MRRTTTIRKMCNRYLYSNVWNPVEKLDCFQTRVWDVGCQSRCLSRCPHTPGVSQLFTVGSAVTIAILIADTRVPHLKATYSQLIKCAHVACERLRTADLVSSGFKSFAHPDKFLATHNTCFRRWSMTAIRDYRLLFPLSAQQTPHAEIVIPSTLCLYVIIEPRTNPFLAQSSPNGFLVPEPAVCRCPTPGHGWPLTPSRSHGFTTLSPLGIAAWKLGYAKPAATRKLTPQITCKTFCEQTQSTQSCTILVIILIKSPLKHM